MGVYHIENMEYVQFILLTICVLHSKGQRLTYSFLQFLEDDSKYHGSEPNVSCTELGERVMNAEGNDTKPNGS